MHIFRAHIRVNVSPQHDSRAATNVEGTETLQDVWNPEAWKEDDVEDQEVVEQQEQTMYDGIVVKTVLDEGKRSYLYEY